MTMGGVVRRVTLGDQQPDTEPVIRVRPADDHEWDSRCNGCLARDVRAVLEVGNTRSTYQFRMCGACLVRLEHAVPRPEGMLYTHEPQERPGERHEGRREECRFIVCRRERNEE